MIPDNQRLQVDIRNLPLGVVPALKMTALENGVSLTDLVRTIIVGAALKADRPNGKSKKYEPVV